MTLAVLYNSVFNMFEVQKHPERNTTKKREKENSNIAVLSYQTPVI